MRSFVTWSQHGCSRAFLLSDAVCVAMREQDRDRKSAEYKHQTSQRIKSFAPS